MRIFSTGGFQREVLSLPGPVVAMSGFQDKLMISVHTGMPLPGNQCIGTAIFNIGNTVHQLPSFNTLPLAPNSNLAWQGFTDEGNFFSLKFNTFVIFKEMFYLIFLIS